MVASPEPERDRVRAMRKQAQAPKDQETQRVFAAGNREGPKHPTGEQLFLARINVLPDRPSW